MERTIRGFKIVVIGLCLSAVSVPAMAQKSDVGSTGAATKSRAEKDRGTSDPVGDGVPETAEVAEARTRVTFLLSGFEFFPTRKDLDAVASAPVMTTILKRFVADTDGSPMTRFRAVDALGMYSEADVGKFLLSYASAPDKIADDAELRSRETMRHRAMIAYAKSQGETGNEALIAMLKDSDLQIRLTAISALGKHGGPEAIKHLRTLKEQDTHHAIQRELHKFVR